MVPNGWVTKNLDSIYRVIDSLHQTPSFSEDGEYSMVRVTDIKGKNLDLSNAIRVSKAVFLEYIKKYKPKRNDILFSRVGSYGISSFVDTDEEFCLGQNTVIAESNDKANPIYIFNILKSEGVRRQIEKTVDGSSHKTVTLKVIKDLKIPLAPRNEQNKIAQILSTWDQAILTTEKLLENSQQQKKALMQQLLTGKKRLGVEFGSYNFKHIKYGSIPEDWNYVAIKDICAQVSQKNANSADYPVLSCSKYDGFVDSLKYFNKKVYSDDTTGYRIIPRGCFGFPSNHIEEGSIGLQNIYDIGIVSPIYVIFRVSAENIDNDYLYSVFKTDKYKQIFSAATNASVDRRGSLRWKEFGLISVPIPPLEEQKKIANVLFLADQEIETLQKKLDCLKQEKKALMQQLLTGKKRVKVAA